MRYLGKEQLSELIATLQANKLRTALTGFAVGWGILLLVVLLSAGTGVSNSINEQVANAGMSREEVDFRIGWVSIPIGGHTKWSEPKFSYNDLSFLLRTNSAIIKEATPYRESYGFSIQANSMTEQRACMGVEGAYHHIRQIALLGSSSRFINDRDVYEARKVVVLPESLAKSFFSHAEEAVGHDVVIEGIAFRVIGVCKDTSGSWSSAYMPLKTMNLLFRATKAGEGDKLTGALLLCPSIKTQSDVDALSSKLVAQFAPRWGTSPEDKTVIDLGSAAAGNEVMQGVILGIDVLLWVIGLSTLVIGLVGVVNIMQITVSERRREIGVRKALGAKPRDIIAMILTESVLVTLISGLVGLVAGVAMMSVATCIIEMYQIGESSVGDNQSFNILVNPLITLPTAVSAILVMLLGGLIAGYLPARRAVRIPVVEAMRM